jgi:hypothetical protein
MALDPKLYLERAAQFEAFAREERDSKAKGAYLDLAARYRQLATYMKGGSKDKLPARDDLNGRASQNKT